MVIAMSVVTTSTQGISNGMSNLGNLRKSMVAYKSVIVHLILLVW